jgi:hypothetical protein
MDPELRERLADARERERRQRAKTRAALAEIEMQATSRPIAGTISEPTRSFITGF